FNDARIKNYVDALLTDNYSVDVFALGGAVSEVPGLRVVSLMSKVASDRALPYALSQVWFVLKALLAVTANALRRRYAIVHVHNMPNFLVIAALPARLLGARVILDIHDTMPEAYATKFDLD